MAFVLDKVDDMRIIYETAKRVYSKELTVDAAVKDLSKKTEAKASSLQMYLNIYSCMRKGKVYKMGTSESFTQFLLENILRDEGFDAFTKALTSVKSNAAYRASKDNAQPGLFRACQNAISNSGVAIDFDALPVDFFPEPSSDTAERCQLISDTDREQLIKCIRLENKDFATAVMCILAKHQILSDADILLLCDRQKSRELFYSDYAYLKEIDTSSDLSVQLKSADGRNRYYGTTYIFNDKTYVITSQLYGLANNSNRKDNRTPFWKWALKKLGIDPDDTNAVSLEGGEKEMTNAEKVEAIKSYIATKGFNYEGDLIENFYLSLKSKPFVILAGTSGTGKTRLVKLFAEAIGAKLQLVPVRPDWSDSSDLFGHNDLSGKFHPGAIIDFVKKAEWDKDTPYFLCLDEMNLARVEYYLSDFLSIIETRDRKDNGSIETDALVDASYFQSKEARDKYGKVYIPDNLYIIGTVNMDETTFPFSKKVLDRANTIEFSFVNLMSRPAAGDVKAAQKLDNSFLKTDYLYLSECDDEDLIDGVCFNLEELNQILLKANLHVGYRVRDEISFYMMNNRNADLLTEEAAFDHEIMQKILPRIQGSSASIQEVLSDLFKKLAGDYSRYSAAGSAVFKQMDEFLKNESCKHPNSAKKIAFMMRRYEEDGFTSYWL